MELENRGPVGPSIIDDYPREDFLDLKVCVLGDCILLLVSHNQRLALF